MRILPRLLLILIAGSCIRLFGADFSKHVAEDSFFYLESRDLPGYMQRIDQIPAFQSIQDLDWKTLLIDLYQIGIASGEHQNSDPQAEDLSAEDLKELLSILEKRWGNFTSHLNGDIAFSMGNFSEVIPIFRKNAARRKALQDSAYEEGLEGDEELTEAQIDLLEARIKEEAEMDMREAGSILNQFTLWMDVKEGPALEAMLTDSVESLLEEDPELQLLKRIQNGPTLYSLRGIDKPDTEPSLNWAIQEGVWVVTFSQKSLRSALDALTHPPENSLANHADFQDALTYVGPVDYLMYGNIAPLDALLRSLLAEIPETPSEPIPFIGKLPTPEAVLEWLDLGAMLPYVLGSRLETDGVTSRGRYGFSRETALSRIFIDPEEKPAEVPSFLHRNFPQFASFNWHLGRGWTRLETELMGIAPQAAAGMGLGRMLASGQVGFDLKLQFMDHLNGSMVMVQKIDPEVVQKMMQAAQAENPAGVMQVQMEHPTGGQNYLFALGMEDEVAIRDAFDRLMTRFHPMGNPEPVLFEDQEVFYPVPESLQGGKFHHLVSYSYLDGYFLIAIGDDTLLKDAIRASKDPALQLANQPDFQALRAKVPANPGSMEYSSAEQQKNAMKLLTASLSMLQAQHPDLALPDFSAFAELIKQSLMVSVRKGLVFELESRVEFAEEK